MPRAGLGRTAWIASRASRRRSADDKTISKTVTGTLAEILKQLGLKASAY